MASACQPNIMSIPELAPVPTLSIRLNASDDDDSDESIDDSERTSTISDSEVTLGAGSEDVALSIGTVSDTEEEGSCTTFSTAQNSPRELSSQPSEAELAYAPVWYTSHIDTTANQNVCSAQCGFQQLCSANGSAAYMPCQDGVVADASGCALTPVPVQYLHQEYATDEEGNTYTIQYIALDPAYSQPPLNDNPEHAQPAAWADMCPEQYPDEEPTTPPGETRRRRRKGFTDNEEVNYPIQRRSDPALGMRGRRGVPELVCAQESGYRHLVAQGAARFPALYASGAGLLTVLLRYGVSVELSPETAIRVVSDAPRMAVAVSARGSEACMVLQGVRVHQQATTTELSLFKQRRALMTTENVYFASGNLCYRVAGEDLYVVPPDVFTDLSAADLSLSVLRQRAGPGTCDVTEMVESAQYEQHPDGSVSVLVLGAIRIYQDPRGDVEVTSGVRYLRVSPRTHSVCLDTNWVEMALEQRSVVKVKRGGQQLYASKQDFMVSVNGMEAGLDRTHHAFIHPERVKRTPINPNRHLADPALRRFRRRPRTRPHHDPLSSAADVIPGSCDRGFEMEAEVRHAEFEDGETRL